MRKLIYIFAILTIVSCSEKKERPKGILAPEKMALILSDIYVAENKVTSVGISTDSAEEVLRHYELKIFDQYGIDDSTYKESFKYYLENTKQLESVYDIVIDTLSLREQVESAKKDRN
jgi:ADP-glucose pyrophosphorylase